MKDNFAQRFPRRVDQHERTYLVARIQLVIQLRAFFASVRRIGWMDRRSRTRACTNLVRRARMVAIGNENARDPLTRQLGQILFTRLHRIDA